MPATVLTTLSTRPVPGLVENHAAYARRHGYAHHVVDSTHVWGPRQPVFFRYHAIYHHLARIGEGSLLLVLDQFAVVYEPRALEETFDGIDALVSAQPDDDTLCNTSMLVLRNTAEVREKVRQLVDHVSHWAVRILEDDEQPENALVAHVFPPRPCSLALPSGVYPNVQASWLGGGYHDSIRNVRPLVASDAPTWRRAGPGNRWTPTLDYDFRGVQNLVDEAAALAAGERPPCLALAEAAQPDGDELHLNPGARIAFVSIYTHHIASYGRIHEESFARYCLRHGYGYHLYRKVPEFANGLTGSWAKPHVMRRHLAEHEFLLWVDADIVAMNHSLRMEPLVEGRDALVGNDHTAWNMNSSVVGVRNTPAMRALVEDVCQQIENAPDRSSIHANGGDQTYFANAFRARGLITQAQVVDALSLDAPVIYATSESHFVHFPTQYTPQRAASMHAWNQRSLARDADG
ncbi:MULTISPECIES: hypothetical protein [unclassified Variovorax]|jgi:hypothetical protein|uniref:hypothetical protein n=1 Tax=unclassified Variovorax TaxID=663243 RepID=UPI000F7D6AA5|nr:MULTISPECIES: hypothetical protein [unclassified Variovorax]RSZ31160.1 hypothetical protein EJO70_31680 [Variovorax sp. 553]RSZ31574.1 hypothetical protein EJO71_31685 [Variovorax sp. 679]